MTKIKRIAVMPFEAKCKPDYCIGVASRATSEVASTISRMDGFTLVDDSENADVIILGEIDLDSLHGIGTSTYNKPGGGIGYIYMYSTNVIFSFSYSIMMTEDKKLIGPISKTNTIASACKEYGNPGFSNQGCLSTSKQDDYPPAYIGINIANIRIPAIKTEYFLPRTKTKANNLGYSGEILNPWRKKSNDAIKKMDKAYSYLLDGGKFTSSTEKRKLALETYLKVYELHKNALAAKNAAILYIVLGDKESAIRLMQRVYYEVFMQKSFDEFFEYIYDSRQEAKQFSYLCEYLGEIKFAIDIMQKIYDKAYNLDEKEEAKERIDELNEILSIKTEENQTATTTPATPAETEVPQ